MHETLLFVLILAAGFYMAWNIGANDVANAMGTSVGSGALTLKRAIIIAAILEFSGAFFFGGHVSETIQSGIIHAELFSETPLLLVYGMLSSLMAAGVWLQIASYYGWPVSTTHTIVGAIVGFGVVVGGWEAIYWKNVAFIVSSWILSPFFGGLLGFLIFTILRNRVLYASRPIEAARKLTPSLVLIVMAMLSLVMLYKGLENLHLHFNFMQAAAMSLLIGFVGYLISRVAVAKMHIPENSTVHADLAIVERIFGTLQIMSACLMAFAHGANDVANAIGPLSAAISVLRSNETLTATVIPTWTLALGGLGIVLGLATWGWRVIMTIGKKITELTPTRGFAAEFGAASTVLIASWLGMPVSTTHTLVGAVIGVGLARGIGALDLTTTRDIAISWLITVPAGALISVAFFYLLQSLFSGLFVALP